MDSVLTSCRCARRRAATLGNGRWRNVDVDGVEGACVVPERRYVLLMTRLLDVPCDLRRSRSSSEPPSIPTRKGNARSHQERFDSTGDSSDIGSFAYPGGDLRPSSGLIGYEDSGRWLVNHVTTFGPKSVLLSKTCPSRLRAARAFCDWRSSEQGLTHNFITTNPQ